MKDLISLSASAVSVIEREIREFVTIRIVGRLLGVFYVDSQLEIWCICTTNPANSLPLSVRHPSLTLTQFCARLKTVILRAYETLA